MTAILRHRITPVEFVKKWRPVQLSERAAAHSHFNDVCDLLDHPRPLDVDPRGEWFTFEKGVKRAGGGDGFADVWKREAFAWEYKKKKRNLDDALDQLARYALALESPPLHIVCDTDRFRIVTAYTNSVAKSYDLSLEDILDGEKRSYLEKAFHEPSKLKPGAKRSDLTKQAADKFSTLAQRLQGKGYAPDDVAHFVNRLVFLFFAEDVKILKEGFFRRTIRELAGRPDDARELLTGLFCTFQKGGRFGLDLLPWINGGLFDEREALALDEHEIGLLQAAGSHKWDHIDPTIFGTLFERFLDPDKRSQIGAHYTDAKMIGQIIEPVILRPLREEWQATRSDIEALVKKASAKGAKSKDWQRAEERRSVFLERLRTLSILDPACGSGNFLYLALHSVKDLEHAANQECESMGLPPRMPMVGPEILRGIEINPLAAELARTTIWIGDIQWAIRHGIRSRPEPILRRLDMIECRDALSSVDDKSKEGVDVDINAFWPKAEFIIGNPPFLGGSKFTKKLGRITTDSVRKTFSGLVSGSSDLYCYWFYLALCAVLQNGTKAVGFVSKNTFEQKSNNEVLKSIALRARITSASTRVPWVNEGASVEVHLICFVGQTCAQESTLNGFPVPHIGSDLTSRAVHRIQTSGPSQLLENEDICFNGVKRNGKFDVDEAEALNWLQEAANANGRHNRDVLRPYLNGQDLTGRSRNRWMIDFGVGNTLESVEYFEKPFAHAKAWIEPARQKCVPGVLRDRWWEYERSRPAMRTALSQVNSYFALSEKSHQYVWQRVDSRVLPDNRLIVVASESFALFGVLQSKYHEKWMEVHGSLLQDRRCYTPTTTFATFPFPIIHSRLPDLNESGNDPVRSSISKAAQRLFVDRDQWLNPEGWTVEETDMRYGFMPTRPAVRSELARKIKDRTLVKLYNANPSWLQTCHRCLDAAVAAAYGWPEDISTEDALAALLELNRERAAAQGKV